MYELDVGKNNPQSLKHKQLTMKWGHHVIAREELSNSSSSNF